MTNFSKAFAFLLFVGFSCLVSCKKDSLNSVASSESVRKTKFKINEISLESLILDPNDKENENIDRENVEIAKVLLELSKSKDFANFIVKTAKANSGTVKYAQIFSQYPDLLSKFDKTVIAKRFNKSNSYIDPSTYDYVHNGYAYESVVYVPNYMSIPSEIDVDGLAVSPAIEIGDDLDNENYDLIYAWELQPNGSTYQVSIGSNDGDYAPTPVFTTGLNLVGDLSAPTVIELRKPTVDDSDNKATQLSLRSNPTCNTNTFVLNEFYDKWRSQEYCAVGVESFTVSGQTDGTTRGIGASGFDLPQPNNWFIRSVSRIETGSGQFSGIGLPILWPKFFYTILASSAAHYVYYNTYEWDWYATPKAMGTVKFPNNGGFHEFQAKRKYYEEWFTFAPGPDCGRDVQAKGTLSHLRLLRFPGSRMYSSGTFSEIFDDDKGSLSFQRVNP